MLKLIVWISKLLGKRSSYKNAGRLVPVLGSAAGAWINYKFAQRAGNKMIAAFKEEHAQS
ncbi:MAG: hypothetical protein U5K69_09175 [Balneolaceae bacterium]|nr:hypothetical protein [Balneolaceae bacterium]